MAGADRPVGGFRGEPRVAGIDIDEGVQFRVLRFDARQKRLNDVDRR